MAPESGVLPPRYARVARIASGGMGEIYAADDTELARRVAVKLLAQRYADDEDCKQRFKREALTAARLSGHPHVATIYDVGEWNGRPFIVMAFFPEGTVADRQKEGRISRSQALRWLDQAADALDAAHHQGIVHRDVKPGNLLLDDRGGVVVGDFGIARVLDQTTGGLTQSGTVLGTAGYLSPEQAKGEEATPASDVYSLGVVAYELLTGGRPFEETSPTAEAAAHIRDPVPPASAGSDLPPVIDVVFERALAKDPAARYGSAREFVDALEETLAAEEQPTQVVAASVASPRAPARRRRSWLVPAVVAFLLLAAGALTGAVLATRGGHDRQARVKVRKVVVTHTLPGTTVSNIRTVTTPAPPAPPPTPPPTPPPATVSASSESGHALNDRGWELIKQGRYDEALPVLQEAVQKLKGIGPSDPYEAYADYNLAYTFIQLGRCSQALPLLDQSEQLQGHRIEIDRARHQAENC